MRVVRMGFVVENVLFMRKGSEDEGGSVAGRRLRVEGRHFVTQLAGYFFDVGVKGVWGGLEEWLNGVEEGLDREVGETVGRLVRMSPQQSAMGKWAFWTQAGITGREGYGEGEAVDVEGGSAGGDGYLDAAAWAGRVMALHAKSEDAKEGMDAFLQKRKAVWCGFDERDA